MVETKSESFAPVASESPPPTEKEYTYRLATDNEGNHGYEIGYWPLNADMNDPRLFTVVEKCYGQQEAAARTVALNLGSDPFEPPEAEPQAHAHDDDEDADHEAARARRAHHGPLRHKGR